MFGKLGFCTSAAAGQHGRQGQWVEIAEVDLHIKNLSDSLCGRRIIHISDLHCSRTVTGKYLDSCIERVNQLDGDIVVLTGDYITHDYHGRFRKKVVDMVSGIQSRYGVYACLGNHDYGSDGVLGLNCETALEYMVEGMQAGGINVLRNDCGILEIDGKRLWVVGLGDLWAKDFEPDKAFGGVGKNEAVLVLAHNPDSIKHLKGFSFDVVMCGHTHGVGFEWKSQFGWPFVNRRRHYSGMYHLGGKKLYVNRGLGRLGKAFCNTRPEITVFNLC